MLYITQLSCIVQHCAHVVVCCRHVVPNVIHYWVKVDLASGTCALNIATCVLPHVYQHDWLRLMVCICTLFVTYIICLLPKSSQM